MIKLFVDADNNFLGSFEGAGAEATLPSDAKEIFQNRPGPQYIWDGSEWVAPTSEEVEADKKAEGMKVLDGDEGCTATMLFEALFNLENRMRSLEGDSSITRTELKDSLTNLYKIL